MMSQGTGAHAQWDVAAERLMLASELGVQKQTQTHKQGSVSHKSSCTKLERYQAINIVNNCRDYKTLCSTLIKSFIIK